MLTILIAAAHIAIWPDGIIIPPKLYDHDPNRPWTVIHVSIDVRNALCQASDIGCSIPMLNGKCVVVLPDWDQIKLEGREVFAGSGKPQKVTDEFAGHLFRHERAHCNGWEHKDY